MQSYIDIKPIATPELEIRQKMGEIEIFMEMGHAR